MKVLVHAVAPTAGGGGRSRIRELASTLPRYRPQDELLFLAGRENVEDLRTLGDHVKASAPPSWVRGVPLRIGWEHLMLPRRLTGQRRPDVVLAPFNISPSGWPDGQPPTVVIVNNLAPYVPWICELYSGRARIRLELLRRLTDHTLARAEHVFVLSGQGFDLIGADDLSARVELLPMAPPPADGPAVRVDKRLVHGEPFFVVVGDLLRYKGVETVVKATAILRQRGETATVLVVGRPWDAQYVADLKQEIRTGRLGSQIRLLGYVPHPAVLGLMREALACIVPSRFENPSRIPKEAMALDTPVLASDIPAFRESCGDAVAYFAVNDAEQLASRMHDIQSDSVLRERLRQRGAAHLRHDHPGSASERIAAALERLAT